MNNIHVTVLTVDHTIRNSSWHYKLTTGDVSGVIVQPFSKQIPSSGIAKLMTSLSNWTRKQGPEIESRLEYLLWTACSTMSNQ